MTVQGANPQILDVLRRSVLFAGLPPAALRDVGARFGWMDAPAGIVCCQEGERGDEMYVIESGRFVVEGRLGDEPVRFAELGPGEVFGEMALLTGQQRSATVRADSDARIWALRREDFQQLVQRYPELGVAAGRLVSERMSSVMRTRLRNEKTELFSLRDVKTAVVIGRSPASDIVLDQPTVSRSHALIRCDDHECSITDLNSANGTFVNGEQIQTAALKDGDKIWIGGNLIYFDRSSLTQFSRGGGVKVDAVDLFKIVGKNITILNGVPLSIYPGEFVCIVGGSGAGKTTLLDALNGFRPATRGRVMYNDVDYYEHFDLFRQRLGYVPQDDIVHPELTVHQTLYYAARLRLPGDTSRAEIERLIAEVLENLDLIQRRSTEVRRLSGGQRKRVSIGVELLTKPDVFYLDEPTSGLDPGLDGRMMELMRKLADDGRTVVLTTHATRNVMMCDKVVFMARGGCLAFYGPPADALAYFGVEDFTDIYRLLESDGSPETWAQKFRGSDAFQRNIRQRLEGQTLTPRPATPPPSGRAARKSKGANWLVQLLWLTLRYFQILTRDRIALGVLLAAAPIIALVLTQTFSKDTFAMTFAEGGDAREVIALLFYLAASSIFLGGFVAARSIAEETAIYARERLINLALFPYVTSKVCVLGLFSLLQSALLIGIVALKVDLPGGNETLLKLYGILALTNVVSVGMGLVVSAFSANGLRATLILVVVLIPQLILAGAVVPLNRVTQVARYLSDTMISRWSVSLLGHVVDVNARLNAQLPKNDFTDQFDIDTTRYVLIMVGLFVLFFAGAIAALRAKDVR